MNTKKMHICDETERHVVWTSTVMVRPSSRVFDRNVETHHRPRPVGYLSDLSETLNDHFDHLIFILVAFTEQHPADDVGGGVMKHNLRTQG